MRDFGNNVVNCVQEWSKYNGLSDLDERDLHRKSCPETRMATAGGRCSQTF